MTSADEFEVLRRTLIAVATGSYDDETFGALEVDGEVASLIGWLSDTDKLGDRAFAHKFTELASNPDEDQIRGVFKDGGIRWNLSDAAVVFVTGHGEIEDGDHWTVLRKSFRGDLNSTALRTKDLVRWLLKRDGIQHLLLVIDSCFSGVLARSVHDFDVRIPPGWLIIPSAEKDGAAATGALTTAVASAVELLRSGQGEKYGTVDPFFKVGDFTDLVRQQLQDQTFQPIYHGLWGATHVCLPNPHYAPPQVVPTAPERRDLALPTSELESHWAPRAAGSPGPADASGQYFSGRDALMTELVGQVGNAPTKSSRLMIVAGPAGAGKSAVLSRLVTLSDPLFRTAHGDYVEAVPDAQLPAVGAVDVAVVATGKHEADVLDQIIGALEDEPTGPSPANAIGATPPLPPDTLADLPAGPAGRSATDIKPIRGAYHDRIRKCQDLIESRAQRGQSTTVVLDALDEALNPHGLTQLLAFLLESIGLSLCVGVRAPATESSVEHKGVELTLVHLLRRSTPADRVEFHVDADQWWEHADLVRYAKKLMSGIEGSVYASASEKEMASIAEAVASRAGKSFLVARLAASWLASAPGRVDLADDAWLAVLDEDETSVFMADLEAEFGAGPSSETVFDVLRAVAFAEGNGLPWGEIWPAVANAVAGAQSRYGDRDIADLLASRMSGYLVRGVEDGVTVYRIFHDAVRALLRVAPGGTSGDRAVLGSTNVEGASGEGANVDSTAVDGGHLGFQGGLGSSRLIDAAERAVQARIARRLARMVEDEGTGWLEAPPYVLRHLSEHALAGGVLETLTRRVDFMAASEPRRLASALRELAREERLSEGLATAAGSLTRAYLELGADRVGESVALRAANLSMRVAMSATPNPAGPDNTTDVADPADRNGQTGAADPADMSDAVGLADLVELVPWRHIYGHESLPTNGPYVYAADLRVAALASVDGRSLDMVVADVDHRLHVWHGWADTVDRSWDAHLAAIHAVEVLNTEVHGRIVVSAGEDQSVRVWDFDTGLPVMRFALPSVPLCLSTVPKVVPAVASAVDPAVRPAVDPVVIVGCADGTVVGLDLVAGRVALTYQVHQDAVTAVRAVYDGELKFVTGSLDRCVCITDAITGLERERFVGPRGSVLDVLVISDTASDGGANGGVDSAARRPLIAAAYADESVWLLPLMGGESKRFSGHRAGVNALACATVGGRRVLVSAGADTTVHIWDIETEATEAVLTGHRSGVRHARVVDVDDTPVLITAGGDRGIRVWPLDANTVVEAREPAASRPNPHPDPTPDPEPHPDSPGVDGPHDRTPSNATPEQTETPRPLIRSLAVFDDSGLIATGALDGTIQVTTATGEHVATWHAHDHPVLALAPVNLPNAPTLASADATGSIRLWDVASGERRRPYRPGVRTSIWDLTPTVVHGRPALISAGRDGSVRITDLETGKTRKLATSRERFWGVACTRWRGRTILAAGSTDRTVWLWDAETGELVERFFGHTRGTRYVDFMEVDGQLRVIATSAEPTVMTWNVDGSEPPRLLKGHSAGVWGLSTSTVFNTPLLATASEDMTIRLWNLSTGRSVPIPLSTPAHKVGLNGDHLTATTDDGVLILKLQPALLAELRIGP